MKTKILGLVLAIAGLTSVGVIHSASKRQQAKDDESDKRGTYKERLQRAKARGDKKLRSHSVIPLYAHVDLDGALAIYDLVIGEFVSSKSFATDDEGNIVTWYKFKIHETLSKARMQGSGIDLPPAELLPLAKDEILVWKTGGSVEIDGMEIEMEEVGFPPFEKSTKYLLVLAVDHAKQAGNVQVGPSGALIIKSDDTLESIQKDRHYFKTQIEDRYGASITKLREKLK
jgi:hypothetical protein